MGITLIVNPGSSSKKFALYNKDSSLLLNAYVESSPKGYDICVLINGLQQQCSPINSQHFHESLGDFISLAKEKGIISDFLDISKVVVRVVAPGTFFQKHSEINSEYVKKLKASQSVAPLHIPHLLREVEVIKKLLPKAQIIAASDSAFHSTIPDYIRKYSLPDSDTNKHDIYRFGYHGLSVSSVIGRIHAVTGMCSKRTIVCHIGSGVSITAVKDEKSFDTSMGYSPGSGLIMGSRAGDLDTGALLNLMQAKNLKPIDAQTYIQTHGGLFGLSGIVDLRLLLEKRIHGDPVATRAIASFVYQIQKTIGGYVAGLGGVDLLVFTATASERSSTLRTLITKDLSFLGIELDAEKNELCVSKDGVISSIGSLVKVAVIKTDESSEMLKVGKEI